MRGNQLEPWAITVWAHTSEGDISNVTGTLNGTNATGSVGRAQPPPPTNQQTRGERAKLASLTFYFYVSNELPLCWEAFLYSSTLVLIRTKVTLEIVCSLDSAPTRMWFTLCLLELKWPLLYVSHVMVSLCSVDFEPSNNIIIIRYQGSCCFPELPWKGNWNGDGGSSSIGNTVLFIH